MTVIKRVTPQEAADLMKQGYVYVDVRSRAEFAMMRPAGSVNVPLLDADAIGRRVPNPEFVSTMKSKFPPGSKIVIGCQTGNRSMRAAQILETEGWTDLVEQRAGMAGARDMTGRVTDAGWVDAGLPVENG